MNLDMATAEAAGGKVFAAAAEGKPVPLSWLIDAEGSPTSDPQLFCQQKAFLAPMAGHKGYGLALMIEILSGGLSGAALRSKVGRWMNDPPEQATDHSHAFLAINPDTFLGKAVFPGHMDDLFRGIRGHPAMKGVDHIKIPGEIEQAKRQKALAGNIELPDDVIQSLRTTAEENGVPVPGFLS
jgi:LDH2 family malate/lactate/ureidoglycolate dehydrogenase